jgi:hypothetical protein
MCNSPNIKEAKIVERKFIHKQGCCRDGQWNIHKWGEQLYDALLKISQWVIDLAPSLIIDWISFMFQ